MFDAVDLSKKMKKEEYKAVVPPLKEKLGELQRRVHAAGIPAMVVFEGWEPMSMASVINKVLLPLDPRGFSYQNTTAPERLERQMPFIWRFWMRTPWRGSIAIFDRSWYSRTVTECLDEGKCKSLPQEMIDDINRFEELLADDGTVIIKLFLHTSKTEDRKSSHKASPEACGLLTEDLDSERLFRKHLPLLEEIMQRTDTAHAPWIIVESDDPEYAEVKVLRNIVDRLETALTRPAVKETVPGAVMGTSPRAKIDLSVKLSDDDYKDRLDKLQNKIREAQCELFRKKKRLVVVFEGRDASGKGGNINRLAQAMNPRTYEVVPTGAPDDMELAHHYLWRFYRRLPLPGHMSIFDRSWYGRVLVERVEALTPEANWRRAYREINEFERWLVDNETIVVKLWLEVDKETQLKRFIERVDDPRKTWKITADDWAAREKWDRYTEAIDEMLERTSSAHAPWTVIASNDKNHSRVETIRTIVDAVERAL
ncbi:MAG: polyphosphate:AMP phosphotransferase [Methanomassiliicoccus sp.]|nr:polyphosphate:AMP phosphotransferase [Methanomassiliicoccus sp.]